MQKIRVVGVGAFGSFVGDEFHRNGHEVIGYDDANPHAASRGVSVRTIRGDYADPEELEIARKCRDEWKEKHGSNFYADGRFVVYRPDDDFIEHINEARARLKLVPRIINSPEAVKKLERLYGPAVVPENGKLVLNEDDGLIDLEKAIQRAGESITRRPGVQRLIYSADSKKITGLELVGGITDDTNEDFVVLTAGVWTLKLLRDAKIPYLGELPRIVGLFSFPVFLTEEHASKLRREPALSVIGDGQFTVSLGKDPKGWVTWVKRPFRVHDLSNQTGYSSTNLATRAKMEVWEWLQSFPDFREAQIGHPIYNFDGVTSDQHHQVFRLKDRDGDIDLNAIVATNGSWHGAKKSPEIARQVTHVYRGEKSIYGCGERTRHPHQPRLFENEYFPDLETRACTVEHVEELRPYVHQRWAVFDDISELKKRLKTDTI